MTIFSIALLAILTIVVIFLLIFLLVGGTKFFNVVTQMKEELNSLNNNMAGVIYSNNRDHQDFNKQLKEHETSINSLDKRVGEHAQILKKITA